MPNVIIANLDCELEYAQAHCPGPHRPLPQKVQRAISIASYSMAVFARQGDSMWTMNPAPAANEHGLIPLWGDREHCTDLPFTNALYWGQSQHRIPCLPTPEATPEMTWQQSLWHLQCSPEIAAACNDKTLSVTIPLDSQWSLSNRCVVQSMAEFDHYIASAPLGPDDSWVAKVPYSASGRERVKRRGRILDGEMRVRTERLLARYGQLLVEPWMNRVADFGTMGIVHETSSHNRIFPTHKLVNDAMGVFRGIQISDHVIAQELGEEHALALQSTAKAVANTLGTMGYRGPFGIDSFLYKSREGDLRLNALCEINARLSFGLVARALAEKQGADDYHFAL